MSELRGDTYDLRMNFDWKKSNGEDQGTFQRD